MTISRRKPGLFKHRNMRTEQDLRDRDVLMAQQKYRKEDRQKLRGDQSYAVGRCLYFLKDMITERIPDDKDECANLTKSLTTTHWADAEWGIDIKLLRPVDYKISGELKNKISTMIKIIRESRTGLEYSHLATQAFELNTIMYDEKAKLDEKSKAVDELLIAVTEVARNHSSIRQQPSDTPSLSI